MLVGSIQLLTKCFKRVKFYQVTFSFMLIFACRLYLSFVLSCLLHYVSTFLPELTKLYVTIYYRYVFTGVSLSRGARVWWGCA